MQIRVPSKMRVFSAMNFQSQSRLLYGTNREFFPKDLAQVDDNLVEMSLDHCDKLALKITSSNDYLLVEEMGRKIHVFAFGWTYSFKSNMSLTERQKRNALKDKVLQLVLKHRRGQLHSVATNDTVKTSNQRPHLYLIPSS